MDLEHESGSSQHSESRPEVISWSASSDHSQSYPQLRVRNASSDHFVMHPEVIDGSESSMRSEFHPEIIEEIVSIEHSESQPDAAVNEGDRVMPLIKLDSSSSFSSSSSASSSDDLFQVNTKESFNPRIYTTPFHKPHEDTQPASKHHENGVSDNSPKSKELKNASPGRTSTAPTATVSDGSPGHTSTAPTAPVSDTTHVSLMQTMSPTQFPPVQVMERSNEYDPFRIPSSVFERSTTPVEWSTASNESLFSIHVGNNSFSRDHIVLLGDLSKSGELTRSGELIMFSPPPPIAELGTDSQCSDPLVETDKQIIETENRATGIVDIPVEDASKAAAEDQIEKKKPAPAVSWKSSSIANHSDGSGDSKHSFTFPIRKKCPWPSCYCSNCSWAFCSCTWPTCYFCNCSRAFCYCWKCSQKGWCCHSSSILAEEITNGSVQASVKEEHFQQQSAVTVRSKSDCCNWFSCFSCCHCSCSCHRHHARCRRRCCCCC